MSSLSASLASPASSLSEFSIISHPLSPWDAAVSVEPGSDDEIVFSPRLGRDARSQLNIDSDDDYILIASPRASAPPAMTGLALTVSPAPSRTLNDEQLATPTQAHTKSPASSPSLPTPSTSGTTNRSQKSGGGRPGQPHPAPITTQCTAKSPLSPAQRRRRRKAAAKRSAGASPLSTPAQSYPSPLPTPSPKRVVAPKATISSKRNQLSTAAKGSIYREDSQSSKGHKTTVSVDRVLRLERMASECEGIGARGVVVEDDDETTLYQAAVNYISSYLANPDESGAPRLPLLQALVVELGLCSPTSPLPPSIRSAKALLRENAHINVRDYIAARGKGVEALKEVMFPSRSKLLKDLRKRRVPVQWIKDHGLAMFLVHFS